MNESDEDDTEELPPFRWNRQAVIMVGFTAVALAIPLFGVAWSLRGYIDQPAQTKSTPAPQHEAAGNPGLRAALEKASDSLAVAPIPDERPALVIPVATDADRATKVQTLKGIVAGQGGTVLEMEAGRRFLVTGPAGTFAAVSRALPLDKPTPPPANADPGLFEVRFP